MSAVPFDVEARITRLFVYPIKSCAGVELTEALLLPTGLEFDRAWMVVDERGEFLSQRELPRMALIRPTLRHHDMVLRAPGMLALHIALDEVEQPVTVRVWDDTVRAYDMGLVAAQWFTDFLAPKGSSLGRLRLVRFDPDFKRLSSLRWTAGREAPNQFTDGFPVLVASAAAMLPLNTRLAADGLAPVGIERFRPNIVLDDLAAHDEDHIDTLTATFKAGETPATLHLVKPCVRCSIPDLDPLTATLSPAVGDYLLRERRDARMDGALTWGMNAVVTGAEETSLRVGQMLQGRYRFA